METGQVDKVKEAKDLIASEKKERVEKSLKALEEWHKEFGVEIQIVTKIGEALIPIEKIMSIPVMINIVAKD